MVWIMYQMKKDINVLMIGKITWDIMSTTWELLQIYWDIFVAVNLYILWGLTKAFRGSL